MLNIFFDFLDWLKFHWKCMIEIDFCRNCFWWKCFDEKWQIVAKSFFVRYLIWFLSLSLSLSLSLCSIANKECHIFVDKETEIILTFFALNGTLSVEECFIFTFCKKECFKIQKMYNFSRKSWAMQVFANY